MRDDVTLDPSALIPSCSPSEAPEVHASPAIKLHSLALKHQALQLMCVAASAEADLAAHVDHPVPRHVAAFGQRVQRVADLPRVPLQSGQLGDLPVRRHAAAGNAPHRGVDSFVGLRRHCTNSWASGTLRTFFMPRAFASPQISFGLVSIPVKLFSATEASEKLSFNMIHQECGSRIQQQLFCPKDERTIERSEVVKGYEFSRGQYVLFTEEELKALEEKSTQQIDIVEFLPSSEIDPIYFQKANYIAPDRGGDRAYTLLAKALEQTGRWA